MESRQPVGRVEDNTQVSGSPGRRRRSLARRGEALAALWLRLQGFVIEARNWRGGFGEIDIVARRRQMWVFVEVKTRRASDRFEPEEAVDRRKREQIVRLSRAYVASRHLGDVPCRVDVIALRWAGWLPRLRHYRDAFRADGLV